MKNPHFGFLVCNCVCVFFMHTYHQVLPRRPVPLPSRLKGLPGSRVPFVTKARPCVRARAAALSIGSRVRAPLHGAARSACPLTSLRRTSARLRLLERRTAARFLHTSSLSTGTSAQQHLFRSKRSNLPSILYQSSKGTERMNDHQVRCSESMFRTTYHSRVDRQKEFSPNYVRSPVSDQSPVRHSARLVSACQSHRADAAELKDTARTFIHHRLSPRKSVSDRQNLPVAGKWETSPWHSAVLQRSDDGNLGRFILRRSPLQSTFDVSGSDRASQALRSADIYGPRYSRSGALQAAHSSTVPSRSSTSDHRYVSPTAGKPGGDEHLLYAALSRNMVGFRWLVPVS